MDHDTESCRVLKHIVQDLLKVGAFTFTTDGLNIQTNFTQTSAGRGVTFSHDQGSNSRFKVFKPLTRMGRKRLMQKRNRYRPYLSLNRQKKGDLPREFDPIPISYAQMLTYLLERRMVKLKPPTLTWISEGHEKKVCEYHSGASGHSIDECKEFKRIVQDLIDIKAILITPEMFASGDIVHQGHVNGIDAVEDEGDSDYDLDNWIKPSVPGVELSNWTAQDVIQVMQAQE